MACISIFYAIDLDPRARHCRPVEVVKSTKTPSAWKFHQIMAKATLARIHKLFEFFDHRGCCAVIYWVDADGFSPKPVDVKAANGVEGGLALGTGADDQQVLPGGVGSNGSRLGGEAFHQLDQSRSRHILNWDNGDAVTGLNIAISAWAVDRSDRSVGVYVVNAAFATEVNDDRLRIRNAISSGIELAAYQLLAAEPNDARPPRGGFTVRLAQ